MLIACNQETLDGKKRTGGRMRIRIGGNSVIGCQRGKFDTKCPRSDLLSIPFLSPSDADGHLILPLPDYWSLIPPLDQQKNDSI